VHEVARLIADPPPDWLVEGLEHFRPMIGIRGLSKDNVWMIQQRVDEMDRMIGWLPKLIPGGVLDPGVAITVVLLKRFRTQLVAALPPKRTGGQDPHLGHQLCAGLVVTFWRKCRGKIEPRSEAPYSACQAYWEACGGEVGGDIDNWRRHVQTAAKWRYPTP
jgi:hypothetical protein